MTRLRWMFALFVSLLPILALGHPQSASTKATGSSAQTDKPCVSPEFAKEVLRLGRSLGYPDEEIVEAYGQDPCATVAYLRQEAQQKPQTSVARQPTPSEGILQSGHIKCRAGEDEVSVWQAVGNLTVVASLKCGEGVDVLEDDGLLWMKVRTLEGKAGYISRNVVSVAEPISPAQTAPTTASATPPAGKERVTIHVVETQTGAREYSYTTPGTPGKSETNCDTIGSDTYSTTNCTTTHQPGAPPVEHTNSITQEYVRATMADGTHVLLWCEVAFRKCYYLAPGYYGAELSGDTVWVYVSDVSRKQHKVKYRAVGGW